MDYLDLYQAVDSDGLEALPQALRDPHLPESVVVFLASDVQQVIHAYVIPCAEVTAAERAALDAMPTCFADPGDVRGAPQWSAVLRVLALLGGDSLHLAEFLESNVDAAPFPRAELPPRDELASLFCKWDRFSVGEASNASFPASVSATWCFRRAM